MITKIYESYTYTEVKRITKEIKEEYIVLVNQPYYEKKLVKSKESKGYCARCEYSYEYGDNPIDPEKCPRCVCIDNPKHSIMYRKRHISNYSHSKVDRCYACWYKWYHGKPKYNATIGNEVHYNHVFAKKSEGSYVNIEKVKEIEVKKIRNKVIELDEEVTINGNKLVWPLDISFNQDNKLYIIKLHSFLKNESDEIKLEFKENDNRLLNDESWYNAVSSKSVYDLIQERKKLKELTRVKSFVLEHIPYNEFIIDEKQVLEEFVDVVGFYPNVPAYIQGHPLNMYNNKRKNIITIDKVVTIYCNLAIDAKADYGHYKNRGIILFSIIEYLVNLDYKVNLKIIDATFTTGETIIQEIEEIVIKKLELKDPEIYKLKEQQEKQLNFIYNILTSIEFYRVLVLDQKIAYISDNNLDQSWTNGLGYYLKNSDLRKVLNLNEDIIVIGDPFEHKISGLFLDDDFENCIESIGLTSVYFEQSKSIDSSISKFSVEDIIKSRNIKKLIHVTSFDNLQTIRENGILPRTLLNEMKLEYHINDFQRLENHEDAICLSVSEPNNYLFKEFSKRNPNIKYHIIEIDPRVLYDSKEKSDVRKIYSDYNAASRYSKSSDTNLEIIFQDRIRRKSKVHTRDGLESYQPTSAQAEILYFGKIEPKYILDIYQFDFIEQDRRKQNTKTISEICREMGNINPQVIHIVLTGLGYLEIEKVNNKVSYKPSEKGKSIGISIETRKSVKETYQVNIYNEKAVELIKELIKRQEI